LIADSNCQVIGNNIRENTVGVFVDENSCQVVGNIIRNNSSHGVQITSGNDNVISDNSILSNTGNGVQVESNSLRNRINSNQISTNTVGVNVTSGSTDCIISDNTIEGNSGNGITCAANTCIVNDNRVTGNTGDGINIATGATDVTYFGNNTQGNTGTNFSDNGNISALEGLLINSVDTRNNTTLLIGSSNATDVTIAPNTTTQGHFIAQNQFFMAYHNTGGINLDSGFADITWEIEKRKDSIYTHATNSPVIEFRKAGDYKIITEISTDVASGFSRSASEARLSSNTGSGFTPIDGTLAYMYNRTSTGGENTASITFVETFSVGDQIKVEARRISGTSTIETLENACRIYIELI
jgi:hypothetical protein